MKENTMNQTQQQQEITVYRSIGFPLSAFDYLKGFQREYERKHGARLNNHQAVAIILKDHQRAYGVSGEQRGTIRRTEGR